MVQYSEMTRAVLYPDLLINDQPIQVEQLTLERAKAVADGILGLVVSAYSKQFEGQRRGALTLREGIFRRQYGTPAAHRRFVTDRIPRVYDRDGSYYGIFAPPHVHSPEASDPRLLASLKMLPGPTSAVASMGDEATPKNRQHLAEILTDPAYQGRRLGSALLHAHATLMPDMGPTDAQEGMFLEAFTGSPVNGWYEELGFVDGAATSPLVLGPWYARRKLPQHYMAHEAAPDVLRATLEQRVPLLAHHTVLPIEA